MMAPRTALVFVVLLLGVTCDAYRYNRYNGPRLSLSQDVYDEVRPNLNIPEHYIIFKLVGKGENVQVVKQGDGYENFRKELAASRELLYGYYYFRDAEYWSNFCDAGILIYWDVSSVSIWNRMLYQSYLGELGRDLNARVRTDAQSEQDLDQSRIEGLAHTKCMGM